MPRVDCVMECQVHDSFRVQQVAGMFDVPLAATAREQFAAEVPGLDEPWQIGVIVGPSGSGKSTVARHAFGDALYAVQDWPADKAVIDCFGERAVAIVGRARRRRRPDRESHHRHAALDGQVLEAGGRRPTSSCWTIRTRPSSSFARKRTPRS